MNQQPLCLVDLCHLCGNPVADTPRARVLIHTSQGQIPAHVTCAANEAQRLLRVIQERHSMLVPEEAIP